MLLILSGIEAVDGATEAVREALSSGPDAEIILTEFEDCGGNCQR
jgi:hypothetical protein